MENQMNQIVKSVNSKMNQFMVDINNGNYIEKKINHFIKSEFEEVFSEILILDKEQFINQIKNGVLLSLEDLYSSTCLANEHLLDIINTNMISIKNEYTNNFNFLSKFWGNHEKLMKRRIVSQPEEILTIFRKHCINSDEYAYHNCNLKNNTFLVVREETQTNKIKYLICSACKRVYLSTFVLCRCNKCNSDYYTNILNSKEDMDLLPATWDNYHCPQIINEKMKCIKCKDVFYINMKTGMLICLNKKCGFVSKPSRISWTCTVCKKDFRSGIAPYNPLDLIIIKRVIKQTLLVKHLAHPNNIPCCKLNVFFTDFYHKNLCRGILYVGELNDSLIIVCDKCHAINFYNRFIWTCPQCGKRFRDKVNNTPKDFLLNERSSSNSNIINNNNNGNNNNDKIERQSSIKNIISSNSNRRIINNNESNESKTINNNSTTTNNLNANTTIVEESPQRRRMRDIKENSNNSGYFNFDGVKNILDKMDENSQTIENNKVQTNNEIKRERTNYFEKYREKKERIRKEKEERERKEKEEREKKEKEEKEKKEKEKEEKEKEKEEKEKEEKLKNEISERKKIRKKRNVIRNDIYHRKQVDENGKKSRFKFSYNLTEENMVKKENAKNFVYQGNKIKKDNKLNSNDMNNNNNNNNINSQNDISNNNSNNNNNNNNMNYKRHFRHHNNEIVEEEIEGDDEEEIEEEEIENHNKYKNNNNKKNDNEKKDNNIKRRRPEGRKTRGKEIKEDEPKKEILPQELKPKDNNDVPMSNIAGISEHLLTYIHKRMNFILSRSKIPIINIEEYILYKKLGEGSYGVIYSVFKKTEKKLYALKKIIAHTLNEIEDFTKEFELVHSCEHPNIMKIYGICLRVLDSTTYALYVLMEYSNGDWDKEIRIHLQHRKNYSENELINILYQLTTALLFMQEKLKVSHRDIKPQNILTFNGGVYKLADFGEAKEVKISKQLNTLRGTELYMSPALYDGLKNEKDDVSHNPFKSDVFSLGFCFLYAAALNFNLLYEVRDVLDSKTINIILHKHLKKNYSEKFIYILGKMLEIDENKRYDFPSLIKEITSFYHINNN